MLKPNKDRDAFKMTRKELYNMEQEFLSQFTVLEKESFEEIMQLREEGRLYTKTGPNAWQMCKMRKPNKSGQGAKEMTRLLNLGKLYVKAP